LDYTSSKGRLKLEFGCPQLQAFTSSRDHLRLALQLDDDLFTKINLSANSIRDTIRRMLDVSGIPVTDLKIFLRQDRDAAEG